MSFLDVVTPEEWDAVTKRDVHGGNMIAGSDKRFFETRVRAVETPKQQPIMPEDSATRKGIPLHTGLLRYFPSALAAVAQVSRVCNDKHNPDQELQWSKENSNDHQDALLRHLVDAAEDPVARDPEDGTLLAAKVAWRALAHLQIMHDNGVDIYVNKEET